MKNKCIALLVVMYIIIPFLGLAGYAEANNSVFIDDQTKDRLTQQYGLDQPEPSAGSGADVGISNPIQFLITVTKLIINPYVFVVQVFIHSLIEEPTMNITH